MAFRRSALHSKTLANRLLAAGFALAWLCVASAQETTAAPAVPANAASTATSAATGAVYPSAAEPAAQPATSAAAVPLQIPSQTPTTAPPSALRTPSKPAPAVPAGLFSASRGNWKSLSPIQQQALAPLAGEWDAMDSARREKWLAIGNKYAAMTPAEQARMQVRMRDWVKLTPQQRRSVRQSYTSSNNLDAGQKTVQWQQYQQLSEAQKLQLAKQKSGATPPVTAVSRVKTRTAPLLPIAPPPMLEAGIPALVPNNGTGPANAAGH